MPIEIAGFVTGELVRSYAGFKTGRGKESPPMFNACEQLRPFISYQVKMVAKFDGKKMVIYKSQSRVRFDSRHKTHILCHSKESTKSWH